jgi:hypothetical protein
VAAADPMKNTAAFSRASDPDSYTYGQSAGATGHACDRHYRFGGTRWSILAIIFQVRAERRDRQREILHHHAELAHSLGEIFSLAVLAMKGRLGLVECSTALALMVPLVLGLAGSGWVHRWLSAERLRNALLVFAMVSGVVLIIQSSAGPD